MKEDGSGEKSRQCRAPGRLLCLLRNSDFTLRHVVDGKNRELLLALGSIPGRSRDFCDKAYQATKSKGMLERPTPRKTALSLTVDKHGDFCFQALFMFGV